MKLMGQGKWGIHQDFARAYFMLLMSHIPSEKTKKNVIFRQSIMKRSLSNYLYISLDVINRCHCSITGYFFT